MENTTVSIVQAHTDLTDDEPIRPEFPQEPLLQDDDDPAPVKKKGKRRSSTHLKIVRLPGMNWKSMAVSC
jgi:hypothetical protein